MYRIGTITLPVLLLLTFPNTVRADVIWPAVYIVSGYKMFWYVAFVTIFIEAVCIKFFLKTTAETAFSMSTIGNIVSGGIGTIITAIGMLG